MTNRLDPNRKLFHNLDRIDKRRMWFALAVGVFVGIVIAETLL